MNRKEYTKNCKTCEKEFHPFYSTSKYCSVQCKREGWVKDGIPKKHGFKEGELNPSFSEKRRNEMRLARIGKVTSKKTKLKIKKSMKLALQNPELRKKWRDVKIGKKLPRKQVDKMLATRKKKTTKKRIKLRVDIIFSRYIRQLYSSNGMVQCFTCDKIVPFAKADCGHFVSRRFAATRWHEKNCHPQCHYCNRFMEGVKEEYSIRLEKKYGMGILQELNEEKRKELNFTMDDYFEIEEKYKQKVKELKDAAHI